MKFKVGDRVAVYTQTQSSTDVIRLVGRVDQVESDKIWIDLGIDSYSEVFHPKQCRKLVKKPRRRLWIAAFPPTEPALSQGVLNDRPRCSGSVYALNFEPASPEKYIEFVEVLRKEKK